VDALTGGSPIIPSEHVAEVKSVPDAPCPSTSVGVKTFGALGKIVTRLKALSLMYKFPLESVATRCGKQTETPAWHVFEVGRVKLVPVESVP